MRQSETPERYREILNAAERVIARHGYAGARVSRIAAEAGVAGGTVYLYFANKKDLLISLFRERFAVFIAELDRATGNAPTAARALERLVAVHLGALGGSPDMAVVTQVELRQSDSEIRDGIQRALQPYLDRIGGVLAWGARDGSFSPDLDVRLGKRMVFGTLDQCVTAWVMSGRRYDLSALAPAVSRLLLRGLSGAAPDPGADGSAAGGTDVKGASPR